MFMQWRSHWGGKGGRVPPLTMKICPKSGKKREKIRKKREKEDKSGRKGKNREVSFTLPLLTDRAGYATVFMGLCDDDECACHNFDKFEPVLQNVVFCFVLFFPQHLSYLCSSLLMLVLCFFYYSFSPYFHTISMTLLINIILCLQSIHLGDR